VLSACPLKLRWIYCKALACPRGNHVRDSHRSEEILINVSPVETRVALVENGVVQEFYIERSHGKGYVGNIYKGNVVRVLPGMQAAFVDIGLARTGFVHVGDMIPDVPEGAPRHPEAPDIRTLVREGQTDR